MKPSIGRVVHYVSRGSADGVYEATCRAAIVTEVHGGEDQNIGLAVLNPEGLIFLRSIEFDECGPIDEDGTPRGGTWHWPERVE
jgi:hypothetical protein